MIRRTLPALLTLLVLGAFGYTLKFLYDKSQVAPVVYKIAKPEVRNITRKTVAAGAIVPRREVAIKPRVSGILQELYVQPGQYVKAGDTIATIKIVPNVVNLNSAESRLSAARISVRNREKEYARLQRLHAQQILRQAELNRAQLDVELARQEVVSANNNLQLIKEGAIRGSGKVSNVVLSTVSGMVIEVGVKEGSSVTETNNFNEGTTIAAVADMTDMIFQGFLDESEVGKLKEKMPVSISVGALQGQTFEGTLEYIAPKGTDREGTIEFEVRAALKIPPSHFVRANYSANANIILEQRKQVLSVDERLLQFKDNKPFVEVETSEQHFQVQEVTLGLSDGIFVEVLAGLKAGQAIKVPVAVATGN